MAIGFHKKDFKVMRELNCDGFDFYYTIWFDGKPLMEGSKELRFKSRKEVKHWFRTVFREANRLIKEVLVEGSVDK